MEAGQACPAFSTTAAVSGKTVDNDAISGRTAVLILHGPRTADAPKVVGKAVRAEHTSADDVIVANVVNLKSMAGMWKKVADAQIKATYEKLAGKIGAGAEDYVIICPDYENAVAPAFGFDDTNKAAAVVVIKDQKVVGATNEGDLAAQALAWLT